MKLPAVWIVTALSAGIDWGGPRVPFVLWSPRVLLALAGLALSVGAASLARGRHRTAWSCGLAAFVILGAAAARLEGLAVPANHITRLIEQRAVTTEEPLRWRGRLRSNPARLSRGVRAEIDLDEVEFQGHSVPVAGGLRVNYHLDEQNPETFPVVQAGERVEALLRPRRPRNFGNPGAFDARAHLARQEIHLVGTLRSTALLRGLGEAHLDWRHRMARVRAAALERLDTHFRERPKQAAVLRAMLLGDTSFVDHELAEAFQKTAAYHVLVISGFQVGVLAGVVFWLSRKLRLGRVTSTLATAAALASFVMIVEDQPPIERAALMVTVFLAARLLFRRVALLNTTAVAALLILVWRPSSLMDASFQLSFLAVGMIGALALPSIARTSEPYRRALRHLGDVTRDGGHSPRATQFRLDLRAASAWLETRLPARAGGQADALVTLPCRVTFAVWDAVLLSTIIQVGMLPLLAHYFHRVSPIGVLANIPATLLSGVIVPFGFLLLGADTIWNRLGEWMGPLLDVLARMLVQSVEWFSGWTWGTYRIPGPPAWLMTAFFAALVAVATAFAAGKLSKVWRWLTGALPGLLAVLVATYPFAPHLERGKLEVTVMDVGQGDSIFVAFPDGKTLLVDGGGTYRMPRSGGERTGLDVGEQVVSPYLWHRGLKQLDVIALTHAHQDHLDGLLAVLRNFRVGELWVSREIESAAYHELLRLARERGVRVVRRSRGEEFSWDGVEVEVLWPELGSEDGPAENNDSLVLLLRHGEVVLLLPGDIERAVEEKLAAGEGLQAAFLKVPHHGSRTSTSEALLNAVRPQEAVVSAGELNPFGHPDADVLERLQAAGARVWRTDRNGAVTAISDGHRIAVTGYLHETGKE